MITEDDEWILAEMEQIGKACYVTHSPSMYLYWCCVPLTVFSACASKQFHARHLARDDIVHATDNLNGTETNPEPPEEPADATRVETDESSQRILVTTTTTKHVDLRGPVNPKTRQKGPKTYLVQRGKHRAGR